MGQLTFFTSEMFYTHDVNKYDFVNVCTIILEPIITALATYESNLPCAPLERSGKCMVNGKIIFCAALLRCHKIKMFPRIQFQPIFMVWS